MFAFKLEQNILCVREKSGITCVRAKFPNLLMFKQANMAYVCRILGENCRRFSRQTYVFVGFDNVLSWYVFNVVLCFSSISKANFVEYAIVSLASLEIYAESRAELEIVIVIAAVPFFLHLYTNIPYVYAIIYMVDCNPPILDMHFNLQSMNWKFRTMCIRQIS